MRPGVDEKKQQSRHSLSPNTLLGRDLPPLRIDWPLRLVHGYLSYGRCDSLSGRPGDSVLGDPAAVFHQAAAAACQKTPVNRARREIRKEWGGGINAETSASSCGSQSSC